MSKDGSITVPVFCGKSVIARVKLIPEPGMTKEEFCKRGIEVLTETILDIVDKERLCGKIRI
jgi:hypothetical protein